MKKPKKDAILEDRIHNEAIVDAYGPEEQATGGSYYLDSKICFLFRSVAWSPERCRRSEG